MARLNEEQIKREVERQGFSVVDTTQYKNIRSPITVKCGENHLIETTIYHIRKDTFRCPVCHGGEVNLAAFQKEKKGYRIVALDNSTQKVGLSIFDDEELVYYILLSFKGDFENRLLQIHNYIEEIIIEQWDPDLLAFEDVQFQSNYATYKKLSMLLGILTIIGMKYGIDIKVVSSNTWRSHFQITGERKQAKEKAINIVKKMYNIEVNDDVAEAILLGKYVVDRISPQKTLKKAF